MAIIYSYPTVTPTKTDLILGTDVSVKGKPTKNFTVQSIIDLVTVATGDLQTVLDLGFVAVGKDIDLTNNTFKGAGFQTQDTQTPANVLVNITGQVGTGFTDFQSTRITGTLQTPAQTNITSLGTLTSLKIGSATPDVTSIETTITSPGTNLALATTEAIVDYIATTPNPDTLFQTLQAGNKAYNTALGGNPGFDIDMGVTGTSNGNILFGNSKKIRMGDFGVAYPLEMFYGTDFSSTGNPTVAMLQNKAGGVSGNVALTLRGNVLDLSSVGSTNPAVLPEKYLTATKNNGVLLYFNDDKKFETLTGGAKVTGTFEATGSGTFVNLLNSGTYQDSSGDVGTSGQLLSSTATGTDWVTDPNPTPYSWKIEADSGTGLPYTVANGNTIDFEGVGNIATEWDNGNKKIKISIAGTSVSGGGAANQVTYWDGAQTINGAAGFTFAGGATGKVAIGGELEVGGVLTDGTFTGSAGTYADYVKITSVDFQTNGGNFIGNASTATQLATAGTITTTGDVSLTGGPYNYTQGGNMPLATTIADSVIMGKLLDSYSAGSAGTLAASDTILQAFTKLQASITATSGLTYEGVWNANTDSPALSGTTPNNGIFYIVSVSGNTDLSGITDWKVGDWAIYVSNGSATDGWQKLDQTNEVLGSGTANKITKWTGTNTLGTGLIEDDGTTITIGNSGNLTVQGNTTLGDANTDTTTFKGPGTFEQTARLKTGLALGTATDGTEYGTAGQVLTSGGASGNANTWTTPTTGTVTSVSLTETGDALTITGSPITSSGTINIAGAGGISDYINGELNLVTFPTLDNYQHWFLDGDSGPTQTIGSTQTATFNGGFGITTVASSTDILTTAIDITGTDNAIAGLTAAAPLATDTLWFNDISDSNTIRKATIADIVDLGNETLKQVLANGNITDGTDIAVSAADDITFTDTSKAIFGNSGDLEINHNATPSVNANEIACKTGKQLRITQDNLFIGNEAGDETFIAAINGGLVSLYHDGGEKLVTTSTGISVTGNVSASGGISGTTGFFSDTLFVSEYIQHIGNTSNNIRFTTDAISISKDATFASNVEIDGNLTVDGNINHGSGGGTFNGNKDIDAGGVIKVFTLTRATTGCLAFDVFFTADFVSGNGGGPPIAEKWTVVHGSGQTPVYNKIISNDGQFGTGGYDVTFANAGSGAAVECSVAKRSGSSYPSLSYTIIVGHSENNALTFTPA